MYFSYLFHATWLLVGLQPDVMYTGNGSDFQTKVMELDSGEKIRLIVVPDFSITGKVVLLNLENNECTSLQIDIDLGDMNGLNENGGGDPMDVDEETIHQAKSQSP